MAKKEMYTREEVMTWVVGFVQERVNDIKHGTISYPVSKQECDLIIENLTVEDSLYKDDAKVLQALLENYHTKWLEFYQEHYKGLALMIRVHDELSYYYEAWYYFCRPGTYTID
ncbi:hypothetical protein JL_9 [Bacillus phage JL]|uniref:Uncharacterized protein n=1 Tax=Bacillus phage JL TaxID=1296655 RepID=S5MSX2_9CAUD|nr:hypothetical protein AVV47_gp009 [Bacillus phage JL]AGR46892.1 hypothetical protein JL_9 [Bacillus phage JL]